MINKINQTVFSHRNYSLPKAITHAYRMTGQDELNQIRVEYNIFSGKLYVVFFGENTKPSDAYTSTYDLGEYAALFHLSHVTNLLAHRISEI